MNPKDVHELIDNIIAVGWVDAKVAGIAVEIEDSIEKIRYDMPFIT